ncbi:MAG: beta-lactamase family protein [Clostridia bacterium]|nr:beta-lactamase family protein [Clostridia bacterium]
MKEFLEQFTEEYNRELPFYGNIRVTSRGTVVYEASVGYADLERGIPLTSDSLFTLYSISKPFCAIGLLLLRDRGLVDLDAHPGVYVPEACWADERVTIRHLLHHISGLPDFDLSWAFTGKAPPFAFFDPREQLSLLRNVPMLFAPGTSAQYANVNFVLCALIIENVSGIPYTEYMKKEVFGPLGMTTAFVDHKGLDLPGNVQGYDWDGTVLRPVAPCRSWLFGAGDIVGTTADVYCLHDAVQHRKLLKPETWKEVLTPSPLNGMGMGCTLSLWHGRKRITHNGGHIGFRTLHIHLPEDDFDIILLSNCGFGDARNVFSEAIYEAWYGAEDRTSENVKDLSGDRMRSAVSHIDFPC